MVKRWWLATALVSLLVLGCSSGTGGGTTSGAQEPSAEGGSSDGEPAPGRAPGVSEDAVKIGVSYIDFAAIREFTKIDLGDYRAAYQALFDDINTKGGINGRLIEPVYEAVSPIGTGSAEESCVRLTEDEEVFLAIGYFQADAVLCYVHAHETAVIGGTMSPERIATAKAPWLSTEPGSGLEFDTIYALADDGKLDSNLAVIGTVQNESNVRNEILPLLDELGVPYVDVGIIDAPENDAGAQNAAVAVIAERFRAAGVDKVLVTGETGLPWANGLEVTDYRPQQIFTVYNSIRSYAEDPVSRDLSLLDGAIAGGLYEGPSNELPVEGGMDDCLAVQMAAGLTIVPPDEVPEGEAIQIGASSTACREVALLVALLEKAGSNLDYTELAFAATDLGEIELPGYPDEWRFGAGDAADGDPRVYLWEWDANKERFVI